MRNEVTKWRDALLAAINLRRYRFAVWLHELRVPIHWGDPLYGRSREQRNKTIGIISDRWDEMAPKPEDFGLPPDTAPTKHLERMENG